MGQGPLAGLKILEFSAIGPVPFCGQMLSDQGADVLRIDRKGGAYEWAHEVTSRGRRSVALDLKSPAGIEACLSLMDRADAVIEGFRPGVMERLGLGPDVALARNPRLVFGRMTGWGQEGPLATAAGHDINYIAITGALHAMGVKDKPVPPLNLVGDFGGGAMYLAFGVLAALLSAKATGQGQVVDAAMVDGAAYMMAMFYYLHGDGRWTNERRANLLDGGAPFYDTYRCKDGRWIALGALEQPFYDELLRRMGVDDPDFHGRDDRTRWGRLREKLAARVAEKTRDEWTTLLEGTDACFAPVLDMSEAPNHPHLVARGTFIEVDGLMQPAPAPRFSATPGAVQGPAPKHGQHDHEGLIAWGFTEGEVTDLLAAGAIAG